MCIELDGKNGTVVFDGAEYCNQIFFIRFIVFTAVMHEHENKDLWSLK